MLFYVFEDVLRMYDKNVGLGKCIRFIKNRPIIIVFMHKPPEFLVTRFIH